MILKTIIWTNNLNDSFKACSDIRIALVREFNQNEIEIPYQTVTISNYGQEEEKTEEEPTAVL